RTTRPMRCWGSVGVRNEDKSGGTEDRCPASAEAGTANLLAHLCSLYRQCYLVCRGYADPDSHSLVRLTNYGERDPDGHYRTMLGTSYGAFGFFRERPGRSPGLQAYQCVWRYRQWRYSDAGA